LLICLTIFSLQSSLLMHASCLSATD
jgi:hypothetical protein